MAALNIQKGASSHSAYDLRDPNAQVIESHTLAVLVENEPMLNLFKKMGFDTEKKSEDGVYEMRMTFRDLEG